MGIILKVVYNFADALVRVLYKLNISTHSCISCWLTFRKQILYKYDFYRAKINRNVM